MVGRGGRPFQAQRKKTYAGARVALWRIRLLNHSSQETAPKWHLFESDKSPQSSPQKFFFSHLFGNRFCNEAEGQPFSTSEDGKTLRRLSSPTLLASAAVLTKLLSSRRVSLTPALTFKRLPSRYLGAGRTNKSCRLDSRLQLQARKLGSGSPRKFQPTVWKTGNAKSFFPGSRKVS